MRILKQKIFVLGLIPLFCLSAGLLACSSRKAKEAPASKKNPLLINGAGASFPYILYSKWILEYRKRAPYTTVNYQSIGSGGGIRQFISGTLDFGGTDIPVSKEDMLSSKKQILHIPTTLGAVAITYNLPIEKGKILQMDGPVLSAIFMGEIKKWDDPKIKKLNPGINFPSKDIVVVYRADGSGTTAFFTDYLCRLSKPFLQKVGKGKLISWPAGVGGKGNEGVMGLVSKIEGAIAYIGASYAGSQKLPTAAVKNKAGLFKQPDPAAVKAAARHAVRAGKNPTPSLIYVGGRDSYPMAGFSYIIISKKMPRHRGEALAGFLKWILSSEGQTFAAPLYFVPLPKTVADFSLKILSQLEFE